MSIFEIIVVVCLIIVSCIFCSIYSSYTFVDTIKSIIQKRKHKKIIKKLKKMPIWDENCINLLKIKSYGYTSRWDPVKQTFILEKEDKDGN